MATLAGTGIMQAFSRLAPRVQANWSIIQGVATRGGTIAEAQSLVRLTGQAGIRRQDIARGLQVGRGVMEQANNFKNVRRDLSPNTREWLVRPSKTRQGLQYVSDFKVTWTDSQGREGTSWLTVETSNPDLSREQWEDMARAGWEAGNEGRNYAGITFVSAMPGDNPRRTS